MLPRGYESKKEDALEVLETPWRGQGSKGLGMQLQDSTPRVSLTCADIRAEEGGRVHLPHGLLRQHRGGPVG